MDTPPPQTAEVSPTSTSVPEPTPTPASTPNPTITAIPPSTDADLEAKIRAAKLAMEGPDYTAKREAREREEVIRAKHEEIEKQLNDLAQKKEVLEVAWIELDEKRTRLKTALAPLLEEEGKVEAEESALEEKEKITVGASDRQAVEKRRFEVQSRRRKVEEAKWGLENQIVDIEKQIDQNTTEYRTLLDSEETLHTELDSLETPPQNGS